MLKQTLSSLAIVGFAFLSMTFCADNTANRTDEAAPTQSNTYGIGGPYVGTYTVSQFPDTTFQMALLFARSGRTIQGSYFSSSGVYGIGEGRISSDNVATIYWINTSSNCPGSYQGTYTFRDNTVTWTYTGDDCSGDVQGAGKATRLPEFSEVR